MCRIWFQVQSFLSHLIAHFLFSKIIACPSSARISSPSTVIQRAVVDFTKWGTNLQPTSSFYSGLDTNFGRVIKNLKPTQSIFHFFLEHFSIYLTCLNAQILWWVVFFFNRNKQIKNNLKHADNIVQFAFMLVKISWGGNNTVTTTQKMYLVGYDKFHYLAYMHL